MLLTAHRHRHRGRRVLLAAAEYRALDSGAAASTACARPVAFAALCGFVIAVVGLLSGGTTFGSGYAEARGLLEGHEQLSVFYPLLKMISMVGSYLPGIPGGIFAPSLSIGAGFGNLLHTRVRRACDCRC